MFFCFSGMLYYRDGMFFEASDSQCYDKSGGIKALYDFLGLKVVFPVLKSVGNHIVIQLS